MQSALADDAANERDRLEEEAALLANMVSDWRSPGTFAAGAAGAVPGGEAAHCRVELAPAVRRCERAFPLASSPGEALRLCVSLQGFADALWVCVTEVPGAAPGTVMLCPAAPAGMEAETQHAGRLLGSSLHADADEGPRVPPMEECTTLLGVRDDPLTALVAGAAVRALRAAAGDPRAVLLCVSVRRASAALAKEAPERRRAFVAAVQEWVQHLALGAGEQDEAIPAAA